MRARGPDREGVVERDGVLVGYAVYRTGEPAILLLTSGQDDRSDGAPGVLRERLTGYEEDPFVLSTTGTGCGLRRSFLHLLEVLGHIPPPGFGIADHSLARLHPIAATGRRMVSVVAGIAEVVSRPGALDGWWDRVLDGGSRGLWSRSAPR